MKPYQLASLVLLVLAPVSQSLAEESAPRESFHAGIAAFKEGDLATARHLLEQARDAGLESSALQYNLGVIYFRLARFDEAEAAFRSLLDTPHAPLARYNLGLVFKEKGETDVASTWFHRASAPSSPKQIQSLAYQQLQPEKPSPASLVSLQNIRTVELLSLASGYDDNIASTPGSETTEESGIFGEALATGRVYLGQPGGGAVLLDAAAYTRQYPDNAQFDNTYLSAGIAWQDMVGQGRMTSGVSLSGLWFGGDLLERQLNLDAAYDRIGCFWPGAFVFDCELRAFAATVEGGSGFSAYDGENYGVAVAAEKGIDRWSLTAGYRLQLEHRDDLETEQEFFSLSSTRHRMSVGADYQVTERFTAGVKQSVRFSRYSAPHRLVINGSLKSETRDDTRNRTALLAGYRLGERWELGAELSWMDNRSSIERYDYDRTEILVSLDALF